MNEVTIEASNPLSNSLSQLIGLKFESRMRPKVSNMSYGEVTRLVQEVRTLRQALNEIAKSMRLPELEEEE